MIDYTYDSGNKLTTVKDYSWDSIGFDNGTTAYNDNDYTYDANGNMITDKNKEITSIEYNHLNLPSKINFKPADTPSWSTQQFTKEINYKYNALGIKVEKTVSFSDQYQSSTENTFYLDGFQYYQKTYSSFAQM